MPVGTNAKWSQIDKITIKMTTMTATMMMMM